MKEEILKKINKAKEFYVWCVIDGSHTGHYFKTTKRDALHWLNKYIEDNADLADLNASLDFRNEHDILYIN